MWVWRAYGVRRSSLGAWLLGALLCILLLLAKHRPLPLALTLPLPASSPLRHYRMYTYSIQPDQPYTGVQYQNQTLATAEEVIAEQRTRIATEMEGYRYREGRGPLQRLVMENGGTPIRSIIITTWRSGSTFLGDILNSVPGTYYHYEPLLNFEIVQVRGPPESGPALTTLKSLLECDYKDLNEYLEFGQTHPWLFSHNERLWDRCTDHPHLCWNSTFLTGFCRLFPFQTMKVVRLRLKLAEELLGDSIDGPRILLLVRDPRGALQSRRHRVWCPGNPDCDNPALLCADMVADYTAAVKMAALHPRRFRVLRYEELSLEPYNTAESLLQFFGIDFHPKVQEFLDTHTKSNIGGVSSTFRDSKSAPFHWTKDLTFDEIDKIQGDCVEAMSHWGYNMAMNQTHLTSKEFNPLGDYSIT